MNNKGAIFSGFMYVLLLFFLLSLATLLTVLNNSRKISNKAREGAENIIDNETTEFTFDLKGVTSVCLNLGDNYLISDEITKGINVTAKNVLGTDLQVSATSDFIQNLAGTYTVTYTAKDKGKEKSVERKIHVMKNDYYFNVKCNANTATPLQISECIDEQKIIPLCDGYYSIELWGAKTGSGLGGYTQGVIKLNTKDLLYLYLGQSVQVANLKTFNGGTGTAGGYPGGGASDIRLLKHRNNWYELDSLKSRIMVAGGAGSGNVSPAHGGGLIGLKTGVATAGTQTSPGVGPGYTAPTFGVGGGGCGGGGGYYGAGGAACVSGGAGGSGFISGLSGSNAITNDVALTHTNNTLHYSGKYFVNNAIKYAETNRDVNGHGNAKITFIGPTYPKTNLNFNNVRYIKDCINGSNKSINNDWVEIQVIKDGINIALGRPVSGTSVEDPTKPYSLMTDGIVDVPTSFGASLTTGPQCVTIDLGKLYDVDEIAVWHRYSDQATFNDTFTSVSPDNNTWQTILSNLLEETANGSRRSAWN